MILTIKNCHHIIYFCKNILFNIVNSISNIFILILGFLFVFSFLKQLQNLFKEKKFINSLNLINNENKYKKIIKICLSESPVFSKMINKINIFENDLIKLSFTAGLIKPKIYLSTGLIKSLDQDELKAVIYHEISHCQKRDPLRKFLINFISDFFLFLPISGFLKDYIISIQERKADKMASSFIHPLHLASALIKVAESKKNLYSTIWAFKHSSNLETRLKELIYGQKTSFKFPIKKFLMTLIVLIIVFNMLLIPQFYAKTSNCECSVIKSKSHFYNCCEKTAKFGG
ncbi:M56 family metallopeptidase [SCandidatus Aminicenantes bacterium Aminicenantia_JdfR_composite]|nr:M56 family metallopeptidase [SCandidatus Aminicenantes bacterium Aminicenantia_JdfR_composite]